MINIDDVKELCIQNQMRFTNHMLLRLISRNISTEDIKSALLNGEIIEQYEDDCPYPSCLIFGLSSTNRYLHVVCGIGEFKLWLITSYFPNTNQWESDFKTRKVDNL